MTDSPPDYLINLNPPQLEAVKYDGSSLLILAGAGSGKTRVITSKIAYLINEKGVNPNSILAMTFTNKAAGEMRERVSKMVSDGANAFISTFHSFGAWLLRRNGGFVSIYDDDDMLSLLGSIYEKETRKYLKKYAVWISRAKDYCLGPGDDLSRISLDDHFPEKYAAYQIRLNETGNLDFGDLIMKSVDLLRNNPEIRSRIQQRFSFILVDEYQDSNGAQFEFLKLLVGDATSLCVVGDDDQSIYRFRGAEVKNIVNFPEIFSGTRVIKLEENYRSTDSILKIATAVVENNKSRLGKKLWTKNPSTCPVELYYLEDQEEEAKFCAGLLRDGNLKGTAILYRTNAQSLNFESYFLKAGIPYRLVGSLRFYEREEIKDILAFLSLLINPKDPVAFIRIINKPPRGIGKTSIRKIILKSGEIGGDLISASLEISHSLASRTKDGIKSFLAMYRKLKSYIDKDGLTLGDIIKEIVNSSELLDHYREKDSVAGVQKELNLGELVNAASDYKGDESGILQFLENIELDRERIKGKEETDNSVILITMHNTKGLEFDRVIITGLENGLFPSHIDEIDDEELEEERRIFYVSITRAKNELYMTSCRRRRIWGRTVDFLPSLFLSEIPEELITVKGLNSGGGSPIYPAGTRVFHDDYGPGTVYNSGKNGKEFIVDVYFDSGMKSRFLPEYTPLERISFDD